MSYIFNTGTYSYKVSTRSDDAQRWFDRGLMWIYGYNHSEAEYCFEKSLKYDPECAMSHWGIAYAVGPNYNKTWSDFPAEEFLNPLSRASINLSLVTNPETITILIPMSSLANIILLASVLFV